MLNFSRKFWLVSAYVWMITIIYFSLTSPANIPKLKLLSWDTFIHAIIYLILVLLFSLGLSSSPARIKMLVVAILVGAILEFLQYSMKNGRYFDFSDMFANAIGALMGFTIFKLFINK